MVDYKQKALDALKESDEGPVQLARAQVYASLGILEKMDTMMQKQDTTMQKQDATNDYLKAMLEKQDTTNAYFEAMLRHWEVEVTGYPLSKPDPALTED